MNAWDIVIPVIALIVGLAAGFFIGVYYLRKQLEQMQNDPEMIQKLARQMGYHVNKKQLQQVQQMMKKQKWK
jgi:hypothetical protein